MIWRVRRVLTGHDAEGKSILLADGLAPNVKEMSAMPGLALTDLWETKGAPARNEGSADNADRPVRLEPPPGGTILRIVEFPPDSAWRGRTDGREGFDSIGAGHAQDAHSSDPMMHKTASVDYIIVLKGEIYAIMDKGETLLKPGDVLVQRGTNHSWSVRGNEPCIIAAVLVSAAPLGAKAKAAKRKTAKRPAKRPAKKVAKRAGRRR
jgi:mannose-6-phosphate isomerase-like protein (cupin superfamily)